MPTVERQFAMITSRLKGKEGAIGGRESMPSCVYGLVKLAPLIMYLNEFPLCQYSFSCCEVMNRVAFHEKGFCMKYMYLLREGLYVKSSCAF